MSVEIDASGIRDLEAYFERFPAVARTAMKNAINDTARGAAIKLAKRNMTKEVAFPEGYLDGDRLRVTRFATDTSLEARVTGRDRPTSLARFTRPGTPISRGRGQHGQGAYVTVNPGRTSFFPTGFLIGLRNGNIGFAIRLSPGQRVKGVDRFQPIVLFRDKAGEPIVYLLYGPSVDQVFQNVADDIAPEVTSELEAEFSRQFARLVGVST